MKNILIYISSFLCVLSLGFFAGIYFQNTYIFAEKNLSEIEVISSKKNCAVPVINIDTIENGKLFISRYEEETEKWERKEKIFPEVRIITRNAKQSLQILDTKNASVAIDANVILPKIEKIPSPEWAQFVASKRGSVFWPLDSPRAFILSPKNRVFFRDKNDALEQGYEYGIEK